MDGPARRRTARPSSERGDGTNLGRRGNSHRVHRVQEVPLGRERPLERARAEQQDQPVHRQPRGLVEREAQQHRRAGRPGRQHVRIRAAVSGTHRASRAGILPIPVRSAALDPAPDALADHGHDRRAGVDRYGATGHSPATADQARAGRQAADRRLHDARCLDDLFSRTAQRDNFGTPWGQAMYNWQWYIGDRTSIVSAGWFDFFKLVGSTPLSNNMTRVQPQRAEYHHLGRLDQPAAAGQSLLRLFDHRHRADQDLGGQRVDQLLALSPKWYGTYSTSYDFGDAVSARIDVLIHPDRGRLLDDDRAGGRPAANEAIMFAFQIVPRLSPGMRSGSSAGNGQFDTRFAPTQ